MVIVPSPVGHDATPLGKLGTSETVLRVSHLFSCFTCRLSMIIRPACDLRAGAETGD
jgi:hypothetical protein